MRKTKFETSVILLIVIALLLAGGIVAAVIMLRIDPVEEALSVDRVINVLFVIEKDSMPLGSYVLMYYPPARRAAIFDIPGDTGLILRSVKRVDRIDRVYNSHDISEFAGEAERLLGIDRIGFTVVISVDNLGKIVDLLEGVELFIPVRIQTTFEDKPLQFPSGLFRLDGNKAVQYLSYESREEDREAALVRRQRFFMAFLKQLAGKNEALKNPGLSRMFYSYLNTSMSQRTKVLLFDEFSKIDPDRISMQTVGGNLREVSNQTLLLPFYDANLIKEIVRQTLGGLTRSTEGSFSERVFTIEVLNGTTVSGLAGRTAELLRGFGYDVVTGNADRNDYEKTVIYDHFGFEEAAKFFGDIIRCNNIKSDVLFSDDPSADMPVFSSEYKSDFTLIIGRNFNGRYVTGN